MPARSAATVLKRGCRSGEEYERDHNRSPPRLRARLRHVKELMLMPALICCFHNGRGGRHERVCEGDRVFEGSTQVEQTSRGLHHQPRAVQSPVLADGKKNSERYDVRDRNRKTRTCRTGATSASQAIASALRANDSGQEFS
jgi:hypothetical protein